MSGGFFGKTGQRVFGEPNDEAGDADLRADIAELCEDAERKMANAEDLEDRRMGFCRSRGWFRIARLGQLCDPDEERREHKNSGDDKVGHSNSTGFANTICGYLLSRHRGEFGWSVPRIGENKRSTEKRRDDGADGVERLGEIEAAHGGFGRAEDGDVGIGSDFQERLAASHEEKRAEEKIVNACLCRRDEKQRTGGAKKQSTKDSAFVADAAHEPAGRECREKVAAEKCCLNERRLKIVEGERFFEVWDKNIVEIDAEGPQEKKAGDQEKWNCVAAVGERRGGRLHHLFFLRRSVSAIEVDVTAVDEKMLAGDVRGLTGNQKENH